MRARCEYKLLRQVVRSRSRTKRDYNYLVNYFLMKGNVFEVLCVGGRACVRACVLACVPVCRLKRSNQRTVYVGHAHASARQDPLQPDIIMFALATIARRGSVTGSQHQHGGTQSAFLVVYELFPSTGWCGHKHGSCSIIRRRAVRFGRLRQRRRRLPRRPLHRCTHTFIGFN